MEQTIPIEMNHSHVIDRWIAFVSGVGGGGVHLSLLAAPLNWLNFAQAMFTAFFCGAAGVAGKHFYDFVKSKIKGEDKTIIKDIRVAPKKKVRH